MNITFVLVIISSIFHSIVGQWKDGKVLYKFADSFQAKHQKAKVQKWMAHVETKFPCIQFEQYVQDNTYKEHILISSVETEVEDCYRTRTTLNLEPSCLKHLTEKAGRNIIKNLLLIGKGWGDTEQDLNPVADHLEISRQYKCSVDGLDQSEVLQSVTDLKIKLEKAAASLFEEISDVKDKLGEGGHPGYPGMAGNSGEKGTPGPPGLSGTPGFPGRKGEQGITGIPGPTCDSEPETAEDITKVCSGLPGLPGIPGMKGNEGYDGRPGSVGLPGQVGTPGIDGVAGLPGMKGDPGDAGFPGPPGHKGERGDGGRPGTFCMDYESDESNEDKPNCVGVAGPPGFQGWRGSKGYPGRPGLPGIKGEKGDYGAPGIPGLHGLSGMKGRPGMPGVGGIDGYPGPPGEKGEAGSCSSGVGDGETSHVNSRPGDTVDLPCGLSACDIKWEKVGEESLPQEVEMVGNSLLITNAAIHHSGNYACTSQGREHYVVLEVTEFAGSLLYTDSEYKYYKVDVSNGTTLLEGAVPDTCDAAGMKAVCPGPSDCDYSSSRCQVTPLSTDCFKPLSPLSDRLCAGKSADYCEELDGLFGYNYNYKDGECGSVDGTWCSDGKYHVSGDKEKLYTAFCALPV